jgi:hypothetical protein
LQISHLKTVTGAFEKLLISPADGALRQGSDSGKFEVGQSLADVTLRHAELDATLLEPLGERFQFSATKKSEKVKKRNYN